jgi:hypothetical protein
MPGGCPPPCEQATPEAAITPFWDCPTRRAYKGRAWRARSNFREFVDTPCHTGLAYSWTSLLPDFISKFLGEKLRLYKRLRWLVRWSVGWSVCPHITSKTGYVAIASRR